MIRKEKGFSLVELIITMLMSGLVIAAASSSFIGLLGQSRTQAKIVESNENMIGLDILRRDMESAGYGLTWDNPTPISYTESSANLFTNPSSTVNDATTGTPRAIVNVDSATYNSPNNIFNGSDYLVIKALNVARNDTCERWSYLRNGNVVNQWNSANPNENFLNTDRVIVLDPKNKDTRPLIRSGTGGFFTTYNAGALADSTFAPTDPTDTYLVYGISGSTDPVRPFNRADYYIARPATIPSRCAPNTGVLYKATLNADGTLNPQPIVDCVADMQVIFGLDNDGNGAFQSGIGTPADGYTSTLSGLSSAQQIRTQVKEVKVYILTHEGGRDLSYTHSTNPITVGEFGLGRTVSLGSNLNYRWKVYRVAVKPFNL